MTTTLIDTKFDFRTDASGKDPDSHSATLRRYHKLLWSKPLPCGRAFDLSDTVTGHYLHHRSELGEFSLSSDSVIPSFTRWTRMAPIIGLFPEEENEAFRKIGYSIGGMMVFPANKVDGKPTINGRRGLHPKIADRFDLTLECIRRHYQGETSPLFDTLQRYSAFFAIFGSFKDYVDFFLLQDLVTEDYSAVNFFLPGEPFIGSAVPETKAAYEDYRRRSISFVTARNQRISAAASESLA